jgi:N-acetylglucosaminyldiphosphoundecaprenol N-acetyl-beta-D-mannosaminyltransferase
MASMANLALFIPAAVFICVALQRFCRKRMETGQYNYFRDLLVVAVWLLAALWAGSPSSRFIVAMAVAASLVGTCEQVKPHWAWKTAYLGIGVIFGLFGPGIGFIGMSGGQFHYLSPGASIALTALWVGIFPALLQQLDNIPGMAGHLLAVSFSLLLLAAVFSGQNLPDAFFMSLCGVCFLGAFWSRHGHMFRRIGNSLAAMWGVLLAGTSILGVTKGIAFGAFMLLPLGLFAIPIAEASLHFVGLALASRPRGAAALYRKLISRGLDHPSAVRFITSLCALIGAIVAVTRLGSSIPVMFWVSAIIIFTGIAIIPFIMTMKESGEMLKRPAIWSTEVDDVSMDYALAKAGAAARSGRGVSLVSTVNALSVMDAEKNPAYAKALKESFLTLADGAGLVWALRFLGRPVQERVAGIDFMTRLVRTAAAAGLPDVKYSQAVHLLYNVFLSGRHSPYGQPDHGLNHGFASPKSMAKASSTRAPSISFFSACSESLSLRDITSLSISSESRARASSRALHSSFTCLRVSASISERRRSASSSAARHSLFFSSNSSPSFME